MSSLPECKYEYFKSEVFVVFCSTTVSFWHTSIWSWRTWSPVALAVPQIIKYMSRLETAQARNHEKGKKMPLFFCCYSTCSRWKCQNLQSNGLLSVANMTDMHADSPVMVGSQIYDGSARQVCKLLDFRYPRMSIVLRQPNIKKEE